GLLAFAGRSYILSPLTVDQGALDLYLDNLDPSVVGEAGTSLARAIQQGVDLLSLSNSGTDKALVLMSDGEELDGTMDDITAQARRALEQGIALVTVGFGTTSGSTIPIREGSVTAPKRYDGQVVITRYHPEFLQAAAAAAHGTFIDAAATDKAGKIKSALSTLRAQSRASLGAESQVARYQWFLLPALLILMWDTLFPERRRPRSGAPKAAMATTAILAAATASGCVRFTSDRGAVDAYKRGDFLQAAAQFRAAGARGRDPTRSYNLGTALVGADSLETAAEVLEPQTSAESSELRYRALFNLGEAQLKRGIEQPDQGAREAMQAAAAAYKRVLLMRPDDMDAKWNYELASGGASAREQPQNAGALGQRQADQVLGTAAREERDTQAKKQQQNHAQPPPNGKDW
ncbi:MAG TPA: VWA domain-containing protein, partial [Gemmatimonadaceae bacterium]|nr:VWA domain-containing protein [Gemmatimonadaceae bacterium]